MSRITSLEVLLAACACGLLAAAPAWALKTDKNQPINVRADHGDFRSDPKNNNNGTGIYTGHVIITQGSIVLTADKAVLHVVNNELDSADVNGDPATFVQQPDEGQPMHGEAQEITYDAGKNEIVLITNAKLTQQVFQNITKGHAKGEVPGERLMTADHIRYNTDTQRVIAKAGDDQDRVHISFPPKTQLPPPSTAPGAATAAKAPKAQIPGKRAAPTAPTHFAPPAAATRPAPAAATETGSPP
jgi:lipopolysaccharide export system protein LptA